MPLSKHPPKVSKFYFWYLAYAAVKGRFFSEGTGKIFQFLKMPFMWTQNYSWTFNVCKRQLQNIGNSLNWSSYKISSLQNVTKNANYMGNFNYLQRWQSEKLLNAYAYLNKHFID